MDRGSYSGGWGGDFGDQYDPTEYNMGAAASARMHTVLDSSGTRLFVFFCFKKRKKKFASISSYRQQQPQGQQLLVIQKKKKKVFKKLKHITVTTESKCRLFLAAQLFFLGIHSTRKQVRLPYAAILKLVPRMPQVLQGRSWLKVALSWSVLALQATNSLWIHLCSLRFSPNSHFLALHLF